MSHFNHFDFLAPYYDRFIKPADRTHFYELAGLPASGLMLDVGGGTGQKSFQMRELVSGILIADSSIGMLREARKKGSLLPVRSQAEQLPFDDDTFERVIMVDALHHVADYRVTAREMWRVLKPGGRIVIEEPDIRTASVKLMAVFEKAILMRSHFISPPRMAAEFNCPAARVQIEMDGSTAWIIVEKRTGS